MPIRNGKIVKWRAYIKGIRHLLTKDDSNENAKKVGKEIYKILDLSIYKKYFKDFADMIGFDLDEFNYVQDVDGLNSLLDDLYDYCDANLLWIE